MALGVYAFWLYFAPGQGKSITVSQGTTSGAALIGGDFTLQDQDGQLRTPADFSGDYMLIYFGYTFCPDICPTSLANMSQAIDALEADKVAGAGKITPLFITVDPDRDTVEVLKQYAPHFHDRLVALTGTPEQVATAAKAYRVYYNKVESETFSDYLVDHSSLIFLMGPDGTYLSHFNHNSSPKEMADRLAEFLAAS